MNDYKPPFRAFQGFLELISAGGLSSRLEVFLDDTIEHLKRHSPGEDADPDSLRFDAGSAGNPGKGYSCIRIVDTFLDPDCVKLDTVLRALRPVVEERAGSRSEAIPVLQLLLMSPYSQIANVRYQALTTAEPGRWSATTPLQFTNLKLDELVGVLARVLEEKRPACPDPRSQHYVDQMAACDELTAIVRELGKRAGFELRFYDKYTDAPVYFFGKFIFKGIILDRTSAVQNPWLVFVDDPNQIGDLYDALQVRVDDLWRDARKRATQYGFRTMGDNYKLKAMIAMPMNPERAEEYQQRRDAIGAACKAFDGGTRGIEPVWIEDVPALNRAIDDVLTERIRDSDLMIADLSENRPNVYYEAGLAQAMGKPVIFVVDEASRDQVGFDLRNYRFRPFDSPDTLSNEINAGLREIFDYLGLGSAEANQPGG